MELHRCGGQLKASDCPPDAKLTSIISLAVQLGLRCPNESTLKYMNSLWVVASNAAETYSSHDMHTKLCLLRHTKSVFQNFIKAYPDPPVWVAKLPESPMEMLRQYPAVYMKVFPGESNNPVDSSTVFDMTALLSYNNSYGCRGGSRGTMPMAQGGKAPIPTIPSIAVDNTNVMERFAGTVMQNMQHMMDNQRKMMEAFVMAPQPSQGRMPRALSTLMLEDRAAHSAPNTPMLALPSPPDHIVPTTPSNTRQVESIDTPPPDSSESLVMGSPRTMLAITPATDMPNQAPALDTIDNMLDMLSRRKAAAKAKASEAKAEAHTEAPAEAPAEAQAAVAIAKSNTGVPKSRAKAKTAAATTATSNVATSIVASMAKPSAVAVVPKAKAKAKNMPAALKPKVKAKSTPVAPKVVSTGSLILGCSKCRYKSSGCAQCHNPRYTGLRWNETMG